MGEDHRLEKIQEILQRMEEYSTCRKKNKAKAYGEIVKLLFSLAAKGEK